MVEIKVCINRPSSQHKQQKPALRLPELGIGSLFGSVPTKQPNPRVGRTRLFLLHHRTSYDSPFLVYVDNIKVTGFVLVLHVLLQNFPFVSICCINCSTVTLFILFTMLVAYFDFLLAMAFCCSIFLLLYFYCNNYLAMTMPCIQSVVPLTTCLNIR